MMLILIRHGQTDWNATGRWQGQADPPLNAAGRAQAHQTALELQAQRLDVLVSSDLRRARETAEIIAAAINRDVILEPRLREVNLGEWQGLYSDDIRARWPGEMQLWLDMPLAARPPNGESIQELAARVLAAVDELAARYPDRRVGLVAHELPIAVIVTHAAGVPLARLRQHIPANAAWQLVEWSRAASTPTT
ncbi:MAG TPA: histidine phosphatase family protein [Anaerolineae bacterium]|nr:histidine phosphatase family protein [Anaerolineae bacterium]